MRHTHIDMHKSINQSRESGQKKAPFLDVLYKGFEWDNLNRSLKRKLLWRN